ncbi:ribosome-associated translation inhibitor RaiA [Candidatus Kuenenbacteria bacterium]|nr:ribosome-associated translation inhibitor RaiA [Candidatus Kuenenbacteria bacterium]
MQIKFLTKDVDLTVSLKNYIEKKIQNLMETHFRNILEILEIHIDFNVDHHHRHGKVQRVEVMIYAPHQILRAEESANDAYSAFDGIIPKLETQIEKYKHKLLSKKKKEQKLI